MTGKSIGICFFSLTLACCIALTGCSGVNANKRNNPVAGGVNGEETVSASPSKGNNEAIGGSISLLPVINLYASSKTVGANSEIMLRAEAIDPAGAQVSLSWEASDGILTSVNGASAVWQAPALSSTALISCTATDVRGGKTKADISVEVIGNSVYKLNVLADRCSLNTNPTAEDSENPYLPVAGARVILKAFDSIGITDIYGNVEFTINQAEKVATHSDIQVSYKNWDITYNAKIAGLSGNSVKDYLIFAPGYENMTVARGNGDSFDMKRGLIEASTVERNTIGAIEPLPEVAVNTTVGQAVTSRETGIATIVSSKSNLESSISFAKTGYGTIEGYTVPVTQTETTIVSAEMARNGSMAFSDASISWVKPYNYQTGVSILEPFVIGFSQPMDKDSAFDSINLMVQNKNSGKLIPMTGSDIKSFFDIKWKDNTLAYLYPIHGYEADTRYSILVNNWSARAVDGRLLKNYIGTYYEFKTDKDPEPKIISYEPENGATAVSRSGPFAIKFDRSIEPDSFYENVEFQFSSLDSDENINLTGSSIKTFFHVVWKNDNKELNLVPVKTLEPWSAYQIRVKKCSFKSSTGKSVKSLENFWTQFTTGGI